MTKKLITLSGTATSDTNNNNFVGVGSAFLSQVQVGDQLFLSKGTTDTDIGEVKSITEKIMRQLMPITTVAIGGKGASLHIDWLKKKGIQYIKDIEQVSELTPHSRAFSRIA